MEPGDYVSACCCCLLIIHTFSPQPEGTLASLGLPHPIIKLSLQPLKQRCSPSAGKGLFLTSEEPIYRPPDCAWALRGEVYQEQGQKQ